MMQAINTRVVRRSAELLGYGAEFNYQELGVAPDEKTARRMALPGPSAEVRSQMVAKGKQASTSAHRAVSRLPPR